MASKKKLEIDEMTIRLISAIKFEAFIMDEKEHFRDMKDRINDLVLIPENEANKEYNKINKETLKTIWEFNPNERIGCGIDQYSLFGGGTLFDDMGMIMGCMDKAIKGTEELPTGRRFPEEIEAEMLERYDFLVGNIEDIITLVLQFTPKGGLVPGTYVCDRGLWEREENE